MPILKPRYEEQNRGQTFSRRALLLGGVQLGLMGVLAGRMYQLQVLEADRYKLLAEDNRINMQLVAPERGEILDRTGLPLAVNQRNYQAVLVPEQAGDLDLALQRFARFVQLSEGEIERIRREVGRQRGFLPVTLRENLSWDQVAQLEVNAPDLPGLSIQVGQTRRYPLTDVTAHVVGYVGAPSERDLTGDPLLALPGFRIGKAGVEKTYDEALRGSAGTRQFEINAYGRPIQELSRVDGRPGRQLVLSLDSGLQAYVQTRLAGELAASAVVLDADTGEVLALGSVPSFDPMPFSTGLSAEDWQLLVTNPYHPLTNKTTGGVYAPGSTFKIVSALAALAGGISPRQTFFCPGYVTLGNQRFHCWSRYGHGHVNLPGAIQHSCDVYFYEVAKKIGVDHIAEMGRRLGLGEPTGIDLPSELGGLLPTRAWKEARYGESWQVGESLIAAIGQGYVLATPLQLAVMTARTVNGGRAVVPHLAKAFREHDGRLVPFRFEAPPMGIPAEHLEVVMSGMDAVTNNPAGTAYRARIALPGLEMGGKTGTSQVRRISAAERAAGIVRNEQLPWNRRDHALFVGYAPVSRPRYVCSVIVDHGGGGSAVAAPIARDILIETQKRAPAGGDAVTALLRTG